MGLFGRPRMRDVTTLVIETTDVRFLTPRGGGVEKWRSLALPEALVMDGLITNAVEMGRILDELFSAEGLDRRRVITSLSGLRAIPRLMTLPKLQASVMQDAISREAKKEMPLSLENLYLSWESVPATADQQRIYVLGVPRELVDAQVRTLEAAGIPPYVMDLKLLALIRAVQHQDTIIANLEQDVLHIILVVDYLPAIMRSFSVQGEHLDDQGRLDRLLTELTQTIRFYNDSHQGSPVRPATSVYVTGRLLDNPEALNYLASALDRTVERPLSPMPCPDELPVMEYMTNLGLALKKVS